MKKFILSLAVVALAWGCATDGTEDIKQLAGDKTVIEAELASVRTHIAEDGFKVLWSKDDQIGVVLADNSIVPFTLQDAYAGKAVGCFEGTLAAGAEVKSAIYPYSASGVTIAREQSVASTSTEIGSGDVAVATYENGKLNFTSKVALLAVSFKNIDGSPIAGKKIQTVKVATSACNVSGAFTLADDGALTAGKVSQNVNLTFTDAPTLSADLKGYLALNPAIVKDTALRIYVKADNVWYSYNTAAKADMVAGTRYNLAIDAAKLYYAPSLKWKWINTKYPLNGASVAMDKQENVYVLPSNSIDAYKLSAADGSVVWQKRAGATESEVAGAGAVTAGGGVATPSLEPDGSVVYVCVGNKSLATGIRAMNTSDGSSKWFMPQSAFWGNGATPSITFNNYAPGVADDALIVGNGGTAGTVLSVNKQTGKRIAYVCQNADGTNGPTGGCGAGIAISNSGVAAWNATYQVGIGHAWLDKLVNPTSTHATYGDYVRWAGRSPYEGCSANMTNANMGVACSTIDGKDVFVTANVNNTNMYIYAVEASKFKNENAAVVNSGHVYCHHLSGVRKQDQGGLIIGLQGEAIVTLRNTTANEASWGGIYAVDTKGNLLYQWRKSATTDFSGGLAMDNGGHIHCASENGYYYILKPDYTKKSVECKTEITILDLMRDFNHDLGSYTSAKTWSSPAIGENGAITFGTNLTGSHTCVLFIEYGGSTGAAKTPWPMKFGNAQRNGRQGSF